MTDLTYMELNLMQMLDVLRAVRTARLAVAEGAQPYVIPVFFQLEVYRRSVVIHLAMPDHGRKAEALRRSSQVCLIFELPGCGWLDTVLIEGRGVLNPSETEAGVILSVPAETMTGRRYFLPPE